MLEIHYLIIKNLLLPTRCDVCFQSRWKGPPYPLIWGAHVCSGASCYVQKKFWIFKNYYKYKISKHVENLPIMDKSITFH